MLYSRYSNPLDLLKIYINQGRFGNFVEGFIKEEINRRKVEEEKDKEMKLWIAYVHSYTDKSYENWKQSVTGGAPVNTKASGDENLDDEGIQKILDKLFPEDTKS